MIRVPFISAAVTAAVLVLVNVSPADGPAPGPLVETAADALIEMEVTLEADTVTVGDALAWTITVDADATVTVAMPEFEDSVGVFNVRGRSQPPDVPSGDRRRWQHTYRLDTFAPGEHELPGVTLEYTTANGDTRTLATAAMTVVARSVLAGDEGPEDYRDARDALSYQVPWWRLVWFVVAVVVLYVCGLVAGGMAIARHARNAGDHVIIIPPHVRAFEDLRQLEAARLVEQGQFEPFYTRLSGIVRTYIEGRFALRAVEQTTDEFLRSQETETTLGSDHCRHLGSFLRAADLVKFAAHEPTAGQGEAALMAARQFVTETAPVVATEAAS